MRALEVCGEPAKFSSARGEPNFAVLGKRLGKALGGVSAAIKAMSGEALAAYEASGAASVGGVDLGPGDIAIVRDFKRPEGSPSCEAAGDGDVLVSGFGARVLGAGFLGGFTAARRLPGACARGWAGGPGTRRKSVRLSVRARWCLTWTRTRSWRRRAWRARR